VRAAILTGLGVCQAAGWLLADQVEAGKVQRVLQDYDLDPYPISAVSSGGRRLSSRVRAFADFLAEIFAENPQLRIR
jgi:LysR family transcriptional regulator, regulator for bpeEF and oprC